MAKAKTRGPASGNSSSTAAVDLVEVPRGVRPHLTPVDLGDGARLYVEDLRTMVTTEGARAGRQGFYAMTPPPVPWLADPIIEPDALTEAGIETVVSALGTKLKAALEAIAPDEGSVEFGIEVGVSEGHLIAMFAKGEGKASLKVTLTWKGASSGG